MTFGPDKMKESNPSSGSKVNELGRRLTGALKDKVNTHFPDKPKSEKSPIHKGMFPQDTRHLYADGSFDRFLASWSFSTRMLAMMSVAEMAEQVWPEVFRLLAKGGKATIFPLGYAVAENLEGYDDETSRIIASLSKFKAQNPGFSYHEEGGYDRNTEGLGILTISKE